MILTGLTGLSVRQWVQLGAAVLGLLILVAVGITVVHWKNEAAKVPGLEKEIVGYEQAIQRLAEDVVSANAASAGYQAELKRLRDARTSVPARPVRVCREPVQAGAGGSAGAGPDAGSAAGGLVPQEPGPDIGPELYGQADRADELSGQIRGLHQYIREVCHAEKAGT